ncbi:sodium:proton antiporter [Pseudomonas alloputida]|uniref:Sodium:proton antiporter n=1 Tax=Pseudomonas alloputida TaxID=1940621 RepID=A0ABY3D7V5_9PSED|nr:MULTISPECIES: cation:proton antiporter [Pseudomonas]AYN10850.1 sodium:proton antiporter [Pseudomonas putida]EKT4475192.1 cation:proton antiporter [Pseudomonas putida]MCX2708226.1 cation:proton antiporter [Pseudomonas sp. DCB_BG]MDD2140800.1 cation:proton antiporter [Pseudomonas putida]PTV59808.1 sodium:proton antiporter [Pseudomonas putida]
MYQNLAVLAALLVLYASLAGALESKPVNGPLLFLLAGLVAGPSGLGLLNLSLDRNDLRLLAELTLSIVLFNDAAKANLAQLRQSRSLPLRLLTLGLPLTLIAGWLAAWLMFPRMPWLEMALLSTILAPTDAALGKAVVSNPDVPADVRESLNVESGLNDGICVPVLLLLLALLTEAHSTMPFALAGYFFLEELGIGVLTGAALALLVGGLLRLSQRHCLQIEAWQQLVMPALALLSFASAQALGGSGFIAAFCAGLLTGYLFKRETQPLIVTGESCGEALSLLTWVVFGAYVAPKASQIMAPSVWFYALSSLSLVRMLPVWLSLAGSTLSAESRLFIGWFGPRGLASIVFAILILDAPLQEAGTIIACTIACVVLSVVLHGMSALPGARRLGRSARE